MGRELVHTSTTACWCFCVEYLLHSPTDAKPSGRTRVDYKEVLSAEDFALFVRLRELRKELANRDAIPVYTVCTNEHLAEMARRRPSALGNLKEIEGFGEAKAEKYGATFLAAIQTPTKDQGHEARGQPG